MVAEQLDVVVCEPYFGGSHRAWAEGLARHSRHHVRLVTHPGRFWRWRMQGAALTLATELTAAIEERPPDVLVVSGMVHAAALLGLARRALGQVPVALYLHENQLTYPVPEGRADDLTYAMTNWLSMAAADVVAINSEHHRQQLFEALPRFLAAFPDLRHGRWLAEVEARSVVLPVGLDAARLAAARRRETAGPPVVVWNHRWDHDKDPDAMITAIDEVRAEGLELRVALTGGRPPTEPGALAELRQRWGRILVAEGDLARPDYEEVLLGARVALSTARHDYFGVAVAEAAASGAHPVAPAGCNYPALLPGWAHDLCLYRHPVERRARLLAALADRPALDRDRLRSDIASRFDWSSVAPRYDDLFSELAGR